MSGGELVVIKRSGRDGMRYPLPSGYVTLGRDADCHIRVLLPSVSQLHATVTVHRNQSVIRNVSTSGVTLVNGGAVSVSALQHGDVITLGDRSLRWEYYTPADVRSDSLRLSPLKMSVKGGKGRKQRGRARAGAAAAAGRASDAAPRRLEPEVKALLELHHRASLPVSGGERQVAIVQPQRRGESTSEPMDVKPKVLPKPVNKRESRSANLLSSNQSDSARKSARSATSPSAYMNGSLNTSRKGTKRPSETLNKEETPIKSTKSTRNSKINSDNDEANVSASKSKETPKKVTLKKDASHSQSLVKQPIKKVTEMTVEVDTPRKSARKALITLSTPKATNLKRTPISKKIGLDFSNVVPTDLAAVAARGTPKRVTPQGKFVHVSTPRPNTPYIENSPSSTRNSANKLGNAVKRTPRVNPLLKAATMRATPRSATKPPVALKTPKRVVVEKIEDPASIDVQKKSALMALTGRSPIKALASQPLAKISPKFVIAKASIKKISPSRSTPKRNSRGGPASASKRKRMTGTPKLTPGKRTVSPRHYTSGSITFSQETKTNGQVKSLRNESPANNSATTVGLTKETREMQRKSAELKPNPSSKSRRSLPATPTGIQDSVVSPRKSVLRSPSSPRKNESIKFDLSNLESARLEPSPSPKKGSPKSTLRRSRGRSSVTSVESTSEDLLLRYSDESSGSESPSPRKSSQSPSPRQSGRSRSRASKILNTSNNSVPSERNSHTRSTLSKSQTQTPRKSSRGSLLVSKVLETPEVVATTSPVDRSFQSSYSHTSTFTMTKDKSSLTQTLENTHNSTKLTERSLTITKSPRSPRKVPTESYSIVDLVSIDSTHSLGETTDSTYDSVSSMDSSTNLRYRTLSKSGRQTPATRGRSLVNLSLETSTPMVKNNSRLSARNALLKSATMGSAIKRSRSTPTSANKTLSTILSVQNTPNISPKSTRRSKSLSSSAVVNQTVDFTRGSRSKSEIVIDDSALTGDVTITPTRALKSSGSPKCPDTKSKSTKSSRNTLTKSSRYSKDSHLKSPATSKSPGGSPIVSKRTPKKTPRLSASIANSMVISSDVSLTRSIRRSHQSPVTSPPPSLNLSGKTRNSNSKKSNIIITPASTVKSVNTSVITARFSVTGTSPSNKRSSAGMGGAPTEIKRRSRSRGSKTSPRLSGIHHSGQGDEPNTPENTTSPGHVGTPVLSIQNLLNESQEAIVSVKETIKHFEALNTPRSAEQQSRVTRKTLGGIGERILARRSDFDIQKERKGWTDPNKKRKGITKAKNNEVKLNLNAVKRVLTRTRSTKRISDESSVASDKTDENAPRPANDMVITPKSTLQLMPEAVKGKHSTAKKPVSKKSIIDHLDISQDIIKNLFNSPVKRKLSQSMTQYSISQLSENEETSSRRTSKHSTFGKTPNVSFDFDSIKTPRVPTEVFVSPMDTPTPKSPNLVGVKRLYTRNTPKNDLSNLHGVRALLNTPRTRKSPKNDLTNVAGVKALLGSTKKGKAPRNDLTDVSGVKELLRSPVKHKTPRNDLASVSGVKELFISRKKGNSPKNDLRNVAGVKRLLKTPRGKPKSPKNDLSDVRGVRSIFKQDKSVRNALDELSGIEELFGNSSSTIMEPENTMTEFDKLVSKTPVKSYSRAKSFAAKKPTPNKQRPTKSLNADISQSNVEEWLDKELEKRNHQSKKRLSKSFQDTSTATVAKTPSKYVNIAQPKSARLERALKKLTIDAVGGDITITPDRRSRRTVTADKSSYSIEVAKALTPTKNKSIPKIVEERSSLPFKKRAHSNEKKSKTPKRNLTLEALNDSTEALGLNNEVERLSLPIKKRMLKNHEALGHSTPVKNRRTKSKKGDDEVSVDLGPVSPIASSPNVTPRKNTSLREAQKQIQLAETSIRSARKSTKNDSIQVVIPLISKKKVPARGRKVIARESLNHVHELTNSPIAVAPKTRGRRAAKANDTATEDKKTSKKSARGRKATTSKAASPKLTVEKKSPIISPQKVKVTRARRNAQGVEQAIPSKTSLNNDNILKTTAPKARTKKGKDTSSSNATVVPTLVISKKSPKLSPQKVQPKTTRTRKTAQKLTQTEQQGSPSPEKITTKASRGRKAALPSLKKESPEKPASKTTRGRKAAQPIVPPESEIRSGRRKRQNEVSPPAKKPAGKNPGKAVPVEAARASPKNKRSRKVETSTKKHVSFAPEAQAIEEPPARRAGRRKAEPAAEVSDKEKPPAKRGRSTKSAVKEQSPQQPAAARRARRPAAEPSPKAARATRATRQKK